MWYSSVNGILSRNQFIIQEHGSNNHSGRSQIEECTLIESAYIELTKDTLICSDRKLVSGFQGTEGTSEVGVSVGSENLIT